MTKVEPHVTDKIHKLLERGEDTSIARLYRIISDIDKNGISAVIKYTAGNESERCLEFRKKLPDGTMLFLVKTPFSYWAFISRCTKKDDHIWHEVFSKEKFLSIEKVLIQKLSPTG